jgi:hypothetical protein
MEEVRLELEDGGDQDLARKLKRKKNLGTITLRTGSLLFFTLEKMETENSYSSQNSRSREERKPTCRLYRLSPKEYSTVHIYTQI